MNDIFDIKWVENFVWWDFIFFPIFLVFFFIIFFIVLNSYFSWIKLKINKKKNKKEDVKLEIKYENIILNKLLILEEKVEKLSKNKFYFELNTLFRNYLGYIYNKNFLKSTLEEIKLELLLWKKDSKKLLSVFKKSYNIEFLEKEDTIRKRKNIIKAFEAILKEI